MLLQVVLVARKHLGPGRLRKTWRLLPSTAIVLFPLPLSANVRPLTGAALRFNARHAWRSVRVMYVPLLTLKGPTLLHAVQTSEP